MWCFINQLVAASYKLKKSFKYYTVEVSVMEGQLIDSFVDITCWLCQKVEFVSTRNFQQEIIDTDLS